MKSAPSFKNGSMKAFTSFKVFFKRHHQKHKAEDEHSLIWEYKYQWHHQAIAKLLTKSRDRQWCLIVWYYLLSFCLRGPNQCTCMRPSVQLQIAGVFKVSIQFARRTVSGTAASGSEGLPGPRDPGLSVSFTPLKVLRTAEFLAFLFLALGLFTFSTPCSLAASSLMVKLSLGFGSEVCSADFCDFRRLSFLRWMAFLGLICRVGCWLAWSEAGVWGIFTQRLGQEVGRQVLGGLARTHSRGPAQGWRSVGVVLRRRWRWRLLRHSLGTGTAGMFVVLLTVQFHRAYSNNWAVWKTVLCSCHRTRSGLVWRFRPCGRVRARLRVGCASDRPAALPAGRPRSTPAASEAGSFHWGHSSCRESGCSAGRRCRDGQAWRLNDGGWLQKGVTQIEDVLNLQTLGCVWHDLYVVLVKIQIKRVHEVQDLPDATHILNIQMKNIILLAKKEFWRGSW